MRDFRNAKVMARALRDALKTKAVETTHSESLELIAKAFGYENWNVLSARIRGAESPAGTERSQPPTGSQNDTTPPKTLHCSFCGKSQHEVKKLIAGPSVFICDECVDLCTGIVEPDDDKQLFRLMQQSEESGDRADPAWFELARGISTEDLAHYMERGRKGVQRNRVALQSLERWLATGDDDLSADDDRLRLPRHLKDKSQEDLITMQQKAQRELKRYEHALRIATIVLSEPRQ